MRTTVVFRYEGDAAWGYDAQGEPTTPGGEDLAKSIASGLANAGCSASDVEQHEDYGWIFESQLKDDRFFIVLNAVEPNVYLTVSSNTRFWRYLFSGKAMPESFDRYCNSVTAILGGIPGVGKLTWNR